MAWHDSGHERFASELKAGFDWSNSGVEQPGNVGLVVDHEMTPLC